MNRSLPVIILAAIAPLTTIAPLANAQSFPIVPLTEPTYPTTDPAFEGFGNLFPYGGTLQRLGDINNDGRDDLIVKFLNYDLIQAINNNGIWIYYQNETGGFDQPTTLQVTTNTIYADYPTDFLIHDHNNDGLNDIVFVAESFTVVAIPLINTPNGFVEGEPIQSNSDFDESGRILYTDTDLDGDDDLVLWSPESLNVDIWINEGAGVYTNTPLPPSNLNSSTMDNADIRFSDFDNDGDIDILLTNGFEIWVIESTDDGNHPDFAPYIEPTQLTINISNFNTTILNPIKAFAEVNADGLIDIVVRGQGPNNEKGYGFVLAPFTNNETREVPYFLFPDFENERSTEFVTYPAVWASTLYSPGDLDGDGTDDLIFKPIEDNDTAWRITDPLNFNGRFGISNNLELHGETRQDDYDIDRDNQFAYRDAYFDINKDGVLDRVIPTTTRKYVDLSVGGARDNNGFMLWGELANIVMPNAVFNEQDTIHVLDTNHLTHADLDYDGDLEIIDTTVGPIRVVRRNQEEHWEYDRAQRIRGANQGFRSIITQLDSDDRVEILSLSRYNSGVVIPAVNLNVEIAPFGENYTTYALNNTLFQKMLTDLDITFRSESSSFAVGDIDADGDNDIIIRGYASLPNLLGNSSESVLAWINDGEANFTLGPISPVEQLTNPRGSEIHMIELIDHDHDGDLELINIENDPVNESPNIAIYENDGQGNFTPSIIIPIHAYEQYPLDQYWIEVNDLDLDGYDDIQVLMKEPFRNQSEVVVLYGSPTGISTDPFYFADSGAAEVHCADLDGNGLPDLFTCSYESTRRLKNSISIMFQIAPREFLPLISIHDIDLAAVDALDMNRDGALDLIGGDPETRDLRVIYSLPAPCIADFNLDQILDFFDISLFIRMLVEQRPIADLSQDGRFDFFDISIFLANFQSGCP